MSDNAALFSPTARRRAQDRAERMGFADVLHSAVASELRERLEEVNRTFTDAAIVGRRGAFWAGKMGLDARVVAEAEVLDLREASMDLIISALNLHAANDPVGQLIQMRRALRPDGLLLAPLFGGQSLWELRDVLTAAEVAVTGGLAPRVHPMGDVRDLAHLMQRAGLALPVADMLPYTLSYPSMLHLMHDLRAMGETNALTARHHGGLRREVLMQAMALYAERFGGPDGRIPATVEVIILTGWAPAANQQQPLRPGSAATRLADALGTDEQSAGETATPRRGD